MVNAPIVVRYLDHKRPDLRILHHLRHFIIAADFLVAPQHGESTFQPAGVPSVAGSHYVPSRHDAADPIARRQVNPSLTIRDVVNPLALNGLFCS